MTAEDHSEPAGAARAQTQLAARPILSTRGAWLAVVLLAALGLWGLIIALIWWVALTLMTR